jgi:hypothetical protein
MTPWSNLVLFTRIERNVGSRCKIRSGPFRGPALSNGLRLRFVAPMFAASGHHALRLRIPNARRRGCRRPRSGRIIMRWAS